MRAEQWIMLGVVGLGAYAIYRALSNKQPASGEEPAPARPIGPEPTNLPGQPGAIGVPPAGLAFITGSDPNRPTATMHLTNSRAYRGRGEAITEEDLAQLGLDAVRLYKGPVAARAAETPEWALANPGQNTRWFYGRYLGPTTDVQRPAKIQTMWIVPRPPPAVAGIPHLYGPARLAPFAHR